MSTVEQGSSLQPTIDALAKHFGLWNEQTQTPEADHEPWTPDVNSQHCADIAKRIGIRYRSNASTVYAYVGDAPSVSTGAIVAQAPIKDGDKAAAGRVATIACAYLWLQTPDEYRPAQAPVEQAPAPAAPVAQRTSLDAALAQFTAQDIATAVAVLSAVHAAMVERVND